MSTTFSAWVPEGVLAEIRAADAAARAARAVPGVVLLQPGVWGLLGQLAAQAWERATGLELPDIAGVDADLTEAHGMRMEVQLVIDGSSHAATVGVAVQDAVAAAVYAEIGVTVTAVRVCTSSRSTSTSTDRLAAGRGRARR